MYSFEPYVKQIKYPWLHFLLVAIDSGWRHWHVVALSSERVPCVSCDDLVCVRKGGGNTSRRTGVWFGFICQSPGKVISRWNHFSCHQNVVINQNKSNLGAKLVRPMPWHGYPPQCERYTKYILSRKKTKAPTPPPPPPKKKRTKGRWCYTVDSYPIVSLCRLTATRLSPLCGRLVGSPGGPWEQCGERLCVFTPLRVNTCWRGGQRSGSVSSRAAPPPTSHLPHPVIIMDETMDAEFLKEITFQPS